MGRIEEQRRGARRRARRPMVYIICEGSATETGYFRKFRTRYSNIDIRPIPSQHKSALYLVERAKDTIKQEPYYPQDGDQLWCVFDRNGNSNEELRKAEQIAGRYGYGYIKFSDAMNTVMNYQYEKRPTNNDVEMVILAFATGKRQNYQQQFPWNKVSEALGKGN